MTQTEVDNSNKSYYGETGLYLLSAAGNFDCRINLDKEGPIHDFAWSPNSKEFGVVYGCEFLCCRILRVILTLAPLDMPAKTMLFDQRVRTLHDFGAAPYNFISFSPQGRLIALAGFGNLAGKIDIFDRRVLKKVCTIDAPNTSHCEWSPDGRFLLTATLSPRLRVDNGIKIWHCTGPLVHIQPVEELYQVSWRPIPVDDVPTIGQTLPPAPEPSPSVRNNAEVVKQLTPSKPAGAYRPPGARGLATPAVYRREDEGGAARVPTNGTATPPRGYHRGSVPGSGNPNGSGANGHAGQSGGAGGGRRNVPGSAPSSGPGGDGEKKANRKRKTGKKDSGGGGEGKEEKEEKGETEQKRDVALEVKVDDQKLKANGLPLDVLDSPTADVALDPAAKKIRNLTKKVREAVPVSLFRLLTTFLADQGY